MTTRSANETRHQHRPRAIGYLRTDFSPHQNHHTELIRRFARHQGHTLVYVVRLGLESVPEPIEHVLDIVRATATTTLIVPDLAHVENHLGRVCDTCDLITVCPEQLWMKAGAHNHDATPEPMRLPEVRHSDPGFCLRIVDAHRIMQTHLTCNPLDCPRKAAAFALLVDTGSLVPATRGPRERAAARGLAYYSPAEPVITSTAPSLEVLRRLRAGLAKAQ